MNNQSEKSIYFTFEFIYKKARELNLYFKNIVECLNKL